MHSFGQCCRDSQVLRSASEQSPVVVRRLHDDRSFGMKTWSSREESQPFWNNQFAYDLLGRLYGSSRPSPLRCPPRSWQTRHLFKRHPRLRQKHHSNGGPLLRRNIQF